MAKGTKFGSIHSVADLRLIQQSVKITPAKPRLNLLDVPGIRTMMPTTMSAPTAYFPCLSTGSLTTPCTLFWLIV